MVPYFVLIDMSHIELHHPVFYAEIQEMWLPHMQL